jgi:hypothetical protein
MILSLHKTHGWSVKLSLNKGDKSNTADFVELRGAGKWRGN